MSSNTGRKPDSPPSQALTKHQQVQQTAEFQELKRRFARFIFPMTALFLAWYFSYVLLAVFAPKFMATKVFGNINVGLVFGLLQFVTTFAITMFYRSWADKKFDTAADQLRRHVEEGHAQ